MANDNWQVNYRLKAINYYNGNELVLLLSDVQHVTLKYRSVCVGIFLEAIASLVVGMSVNQLVGLSVSNTLVQIKSYR